MASGLERGGGLHAEIGEHLEHVVLDHVAEHARRVVILAATLDADGLRDAELDVVDVRLVPERLEHPVGEPEGQEVLHGLLAEVVVDPVNLALIPLREHLLVQLDGRGQVVAERFLDDEPDPAFLALLEAGGVDVRGDHPEDAGRDRHVEDDVALSVMLGLEPVDDPGEIIIGRRLAEVARRVVQPLGELGPEVGVEVGPGRELLDVLGHLVAELLRGHLVHRDADDGEPPGQEPVAGQVEQGGHEQSLGQVARGPEDDQDARVRGALGAEDRNPSGEPRVDLAAGHLKPPSGIWASRPPSTTIKTFTRPPTGKPTRASRKTQGGFEDGEAHRSAE